MREVADDQELIRFLICRFIPEIFTIKVESYQKCKKNGHFFGCHKFLGAAIVNIVLNLSLLLCWASTEKKVSCWKFL